jgi:hypothetical protein
VTPADRQVLQDHTAALRAHESALRAAAAVQLAALPQVFGLAELRARWHASDERVAAILTEHAGYVGARGQRMSVPVEVVLRLDPIAKAACAVRPDAARLVA